MTDAAIIAVLLVGPVVVTVGALWVLRRLKTPILDTPVNPGEIWRRVLGSRLTPRQVIKAVIILFPFLFLDQVLDLFPDLLLITTVAIYFVVRLSRSVPPLEPRSQEVLTALEQIASKLAETRSHLEYLANTVRSKQTEVKEQEVILSSLGKHIEKQQQEKATWDNLTEEQRSLFIARIKEAQRRGAASTIFVLLGSIVLNLVATLVWTLLGNPGKEEVVKAARDFWTAMIH